MSENLFKTVSHPGLHRISHLLGLLGNPERSCRCIHIAGTNGKGSVCAFLSSILRRAGYRTGSFISPHLIRENERISIDGQEIPDSDLCRLMTRISEKSAETELALGQQVTVFERYTAAAFCYFREQDADLVLLETGLGGRLDSTNVIEDPLVSVITRIDLDHQEYLGNTLPEIAAEKAGIIKPGCITVAVRQSEEAEAVLRAVCHEKGSPLILTRPVTNQGSEDWRERFDYPPFTGLVSGLCGLHQPENAAAALETVLALRSLGYSIPDQIIADGVRYAVHPGRLEQLSADPALYFDGAHNPDGASVLGRSLKRYLPDADIALVIGVKQGKKIGEMLDALSGLNRTFFAVEIPGDPGSLPQAELYSLMREKGLNVCPSDSLDGAVTAACRHDAAVICGSLYLYEAAREYQKTHVL